jgi:phage shock protein A
MADVTTYEGFRNWLVMGLVALCFTLLGTIAADNRGRVNSLEEHVSTLREQNNTANVRLARFEIELSQYRADVARRLERIEQKIDERYYPRYYDKNGGREGSKDTNGT